MGEEERNQLKRKVVDLEEKIKSLDEEGKRIAEVNRKQMTDLVQLEETEEQEKEYVEALRKEIQNLLNENQRIVSERDYFKNLCDQYAREINHLQKEYQEIRNDKTNESEEIKETLIELTKNNEDILDQNYLEKRKANEIILEKKRISEEFEKLFEENEGLKRNLKELQRVNEDLEEKNYKLNSAITSDVYARSRESRGKTLNALASSRSHKILDQAKQESIVKVSQRPFSFRDASGGDGLSLKDFDDSRTYNRSGKTPDIHIISPQKNRIPKKETRSEQKFIKDPKLEKINYLHKMDINQSEKFRKIPNIRSAEKENKKSKEMVNLLNESDDITVFDSLTKSHLQLGSPNISKG